ncbi:RUFY1 [Cordylochernes scorpioides]|uniref:RUFY1 n=1 Tax=Cordylochernes scorpioides TaxID=51811 RepID=A0ABY6KT31_9ARAC|nr:RUFY1 [Cordylochernes scorpioides]
MAQDTIYLCNFRVSVDGEWLCLKELAEPDAATSASTSADPVRVERSNLVNVTKLVVKELIEFSLPKGRMIDSDHAPLRDFFILLEHIFHHGLRSRKSAILIGPRRGGELWTVVQQVEKLAGPEAADITASVRELPTVHTPLGRARAWLRLALMQKKLADYFRLLVERRDEVLSDFYSKDALMMSEEAVVIGGLLVGLNVIDCTLFVKEEDLDSEQGVIDFGLYLRDTSTESRSHSTSGKPAASPENNMATVLDQKNYVEELNRHLAATVAALQQKVEQLMATNALLREDLAVARGDRDSHLALRIVEKEVRERQDTIVSLKRQLDDFKMINVQLYHKLQNCENVLRKKSDEVTQLENKVKKVSCLTLEGKCKIEKETELEL